MKFGKYAVVETITYNLKDEPDWYWKFRPPIARDELRFQTYMYHRRNRTVNGVIEQLPMVRMEGVFRQLALTFGGTNIPRFQKVGDEWEDTGQPILQVGAEVEEVEKVLGEMPIELVMELWEALGEHVATWGPETNNPKG